MTAGMDSVMGGRLAKAFEERFGGAPAVAARAPGRLEVLGNHTDYNSGNVLSVAVDRYVNVLASPAAGGECRLWDDVLQEERRFEAGAPGGPSRGDWADYVKGVLAEFARRGIAVPAFNVVIGGDVPLSAGMSSSAAFEMALSLVFQRLANIELDWLELARIGQGCENNYIGANTGLMDQFSSLRGRKGCLVYSDFRDLTVNTIPMPPGLTFVVVNSMVKHVLTTEYNDRRHACEEAVRRISGVESGVRSLRDVSLELLVRCRGAMDDEAFACAAHVVGEQVRVALGRAALAEGCAGEFGRLMFQSHDSSRYLFRNSCEELDAIVGMAAGMPGCLGARLSGGGFGGITVHLVEESRAEGHAQAMASKYQAATGILPQTIICGASDGAAYIQ